MEPQVYEKVQSGQAATVLVDGFSSLELDI
jgi:hypothetical protein